MKTFDEIVDEVSRAGVRLRIDVDPERSKRSFDAEALFHLPLLAFSLLIVAHTRKSDFLTVEVGRWIAAVLCEMFAGLKPALLTIEWSMPLRSRSAEALAFAEGSGLITITRDSTRVIALTDAGKTFLTKALKDEQDVGPLARGLLRAASRVQLKGLELL